MEKETIESAKYVVLGNVDAGKSSFIGVMEKNVLDNGNGYARSLTTNIKHELELGRTSSHSHHYVIKSNEVTTLVDLCGHEKYFKTTMFGVTGLFPDYGLMIVGANMGLCGMSIEHMSVLTSSRIPFIVVVTKIDICPENVIAGLKKHIEKIASRNHKQVIYFEDNQELVDGSYIKESHQAIIESFQEGKTTILPVIMASNKTGHNINFTRELLTSIKSKSYLSKKGLITEEVNKNEYPMVMYIDSTYNVPGIGIVLSGTVKYKPIHLGQKVYVGPVNNTYITITVKTMKNCISENVKVLNPNESGSIGIRLESKGSYFREMFSKGQIIIDNLEFAIKHTSYKINCDVAIFNHPTSIRNGYETMIHCRTIRQTGTFKTAENLILRSNSKQNIDIVFKQRPEFILPGTLFMFRDGRTKGMGKVINGIPYLEDPESIDRKSAR